MNAHVFPEVQAANAGRDRYLTFYLDAETAVNDLCHTLRAAEILSDRMVEAPDDGSGIILIDRDDLESLWRLVWSARELAFNTRSAHRAVTASASPVLAAAA